MARIMSGFKGRTAVATLAAALTLACGGGGDGPPTGNTGTIQVAINPATLTVEQGGTGTVNATLTRGGGFDGAVTLAISGLPAGVTTTVTPAQLTGATTSAAVAVAVAATVAPGTYTATITATAQGVGSATTTYQLTVTATPNYALAVAPATLSVAQGASGNATVNITRTNFTGGVALTLLNPPAGITGTFTPANSTTNSSALVIAVAGTVAPGNHTLTIEGTATGPGVKTTQLALTVTAPAAPAYALNLSPATLSVVQGQAGTVNIDIARTNFAGAVDLAFENSPDAGITGTLTPNSTTGTTSVFAFDVAANTPPGIYQLSLRGTATGLTDRVASVQLTVTAAAGSIAVALTPTAISVQQGQSGNVNIALTRSNFAGTVNFAATNAPAGVTPTFNPNGTPTSASVLTLAVAANVPAGVYPITVTASGTGVTSATAQVSLTVTTPGSGGNSEYQFCSAAETPIFFAVQDGTGAWQRVTGTTTGTTTKFAFTITQNRGGVMYVFQRASSIAADASLVGRTGNRILTARRVAEQRKALRAASQSGRTRSYARSSFVDFYETQVVYGSAAELTTLGTDNCAVSQPTKSVTGTVAGVGAGQSALLSLGGSTQFFIGGATQNPVNFENVPFGTVDFVGTRSAQLFGLPDKVVLFRNLNVADGAALPSTIDFNGPAASVPATATATITNGLGNELLLTSQLITANGQTMSFYFDAAGTGTSRTWAGLAQPPMIAGDLHALFLIATTPGQTTDSRIMFKYVGPVANQTLALGPNMTAATATQLVAGAYPRFRFQGALPAEYQKGVFVDVGNTGGATTNGFTMTATAAYLAAAGSASAYDLAMPDVAALTGFPAASRLTAGANAASTTGFGWTGTGITTVKPQLGDEMKMGSKSANITVP